MNGGSCQDFLIGNQKKNSFIFMKEKKYCIITISIAVNILKYHTFYHTLNNNLNTVVNTSYLNYAATNAFFEKLILHINYF